MQKFLKFLEHNVQWFALGLGALYLLWTAYAYILNSPVAVKVAAKDLGPDNVDEEIYTGKGVPLDMKIHEQKQVPIPTTEVLQPYLQKLDESDIKATVVASRWAGTRGDVVSDEEGGPVIAGGKKVNALPQIPPAAFLNASQGITTISTGPPAPANGGAQPVGLMHEDHNWVSLRFKVPIAALKEPFDAAFASASDQQLLFITQLLQVELLRQEKLPNGQWSEAVSVKMWPLAGVPDYPGDVIAPQTPDSGFQYRDSSGKNADAIFNQPFPRIEAGAPAWVPPGEVGLPALAPVPRGGAARPAPAPGLPPAMPAPAAANVQVGAGQFAVNSGNAQDREVIVHDLTAQDNKTYRYALKYRLYNPVWASINITVPDLAQQFAIVSPPSEWSKEITIESHTRIFATAVDSKRQRATFELYEWKNKQWHMTKLDVSPGDSIKDWTIVDIRPEKEPLVLVLDDEGIKSHTKRDTDNPDYQILKSAAVVGPPPAQAVGMAK